MPRYAGVNNSGGAVTLKTLTGGSITIPVGSFSIDVSSDDKLIINRQLQLLLAAGVITYTATSITEADVRTFRDFWLEIARNKIPNMAIANAIGKNADVDPASLPETIWTAGGLYSFLTTPQTLEIVSTDVNDAAAGTGLRTVRVVGLDVDYNQIQADVILNGLTPVPITGSFFRINDVRGLVAGSSTYNLGEIIIRVAGGGTILSHMAPRAGRAQQAIYTVPAGHTVYVVYTAVGIQKSANDYCEFELQTRPAGSMGPWVVRATITASAIGSNWIEIATRIPVPIFEKTDMYVNATAVSAINISATVNVQMVQIPSSLE